MLQTKLNEEILDLTLRHKDTLCDLRYGKRSPIVVPFDAIEWVSDDWHEKEPGKFAQPKDIKAL